MSCSGSSLAPNIPPVSVRMKRTPPHSALWLLTSLVVPAIGATMACRIPVIRLNSVDLPTLGRPTSTTVCSFFGTSAPFPLNYSVILAGKDGRDEPPVEPRAAGVDAHDSALTG